ncbi:MAG: hypothetical protein UY09_C0007G0007 [Parcubacteria group bacterium GW2011_GWA2_47_8]|nr:MAG: hypothetical protein UY09_C0007G0007 [Parcubacteria group bacterium GW2011_GWA2_47_8]OHB19659.1 MAG: hypothetical protein A2666_03915 [Parcubacteria group bacterium RIFCSPHIGHO2_01_FULL_47_10b]
MQVTPIKTRPLLPPHDDLFAVIDEALVALSAADDLRDRDVLVVTSKVVAIHQGRCVKTDAVLDKNELTEREADYVVPGENKYGFRITIKDNTLIASAGIDESNGNGYYVLWPEKPHEAAREIWEHVRAMAREVRGEKRQRAQPIKNLGVVITDSHVTPLRRGVSGVAIGFFGIKPLRDYRGKPDIFGRKLEVSQTNLVDSIAAAAVLVMGEAAEQTPLAIVRGIDDLVFTDEDTCNELLIDPREDVYHELLKVFVPKRP